MRRHWDARGRARRGIGGCRAARMSGCPDATCSPCSPASPSGGHCQSLIFADWARSGRRARVRDERRRLSCQAVHGSAFRRGHRTAAQRRRRSAPAKGWRGCCAIGVAGPTGCWCPTASAWCRWRCPRSIWIRAEGDLRANSRRGQELSGGTAHSTSSKHAARSPPSSSACTVPPSSGSIRFAEVRAADSSRYLLTLSDGTTLIVSRMPGGALKRLIL